MRSNIVAKISRSIASFVPSAHYSFALRRSHQASLHTGILFKTRSTQSTEIPFDRRQNGHVAHTRFIKPSNKRRVVPNYAFAFDIDGVLVRGHRRLPGAKEALTYLQQHDIPFVLLTNGGGYHEEKRAELLSQEIGVPLDPSLIIQSHSPFEDLEHYKDKTCLVLGGEGENCRSVAQKYGFTKVVTSSDIYSAAPEIWPFSKPFAQIHLQSSRQLPEPIGPQGLKIDAIFVYNDPRDWGLDVTIILDCLLSEKGMIGTYSPKNNNPDLPNRGYQQDDQPKLFFSNADLMFAANFTLPRLGQGGFREAFQGVWNAVTGGPSNGVELIKTIIGKPFHETYLFAEKRLNSNRKPKYGERATDSIQKVFMVGDNPESDIRGAMTYESPVGSQWASALVRTGVYEGGKPSVEPTTTVDGVLEAVEWAVKQSQ